MSLHSAESDIKKNVVVNEKDVGSLQSEAVDLERIVETYAGKDFGVHAISEADMELILAHLDDKPLKEWIEVLKKAFDEYYDDEFVPLERCQYLKRLADGPLDGQSVEDWQVLVKFEAFLIEEWSIYPEVRAATRPIEEPGEDYENFRVYVISILWACAGCVMDTFFEPRYPSVYIGGNAIQLIIAGSGQLWSLLPYIAIPIWGGRKLVLNNGQKWTFKEQMLATLGMSVSIGSPYSQYVIITLANEHFYNFPGAGTFGFTIILTLASAFMGFGLAGLLRTFVVYPVKMIWWNVLPNITLNRALVATDMRETVNGWRLTRYEFFWAVAWLNFGYYWITNFVFSALSYFDWITWISPNNVDLQAMTGVVNGLGINPLSTFDTNVIGFSSLYTPLNVIYTSIFGYIVSMFAIIVVWYTNVSHSGYFPINSNTLYDNTGMPYNISMILNDELKLDVANYEQYSLPFWSAANLVLYGCFFISYPAVIVYALLNYWKYISESYPLFFKSLFQAKSGVRAFNDRFSRQIKRYQEVPDWWFILLMLISIALAIACVEHYSFTQTPVWTIFFAIGINAVFLVPSAILYARTTISIGLNVLYELIIGYALPGNGIALMVSKCFGYMVGGQADNWVSNQVQSHYTGISPRALFRIQCLSVICSSFVQSGIITWQASGALGPTFCTSHNKSKFRCVSEQTYFNAAVLWGTIGPKRVFDGLYPKMKWCFLIGVFVPVPFFLARKLLPRLATRYPEGSFLNRALKVEWLYSFNEVIMILSMLNWAPYNWWNYIGNWEIGIFWHKYIKVHYPRWWAKYTFLFYNGVSIGNAFSALIMFFATNYHHLASIDWWGNNVPFTNMDTDGTAVRLTVPSKGYFGPAPGTYP